MFSAGVLTQECTGCSYPRERERGRERAPHLLLSAVVVPRETRQVKDLSALRLAFWFKQIFEVIFAAINFDSFRKKTKNNN